MRFTNLKLRNKTVLFMISLVILAVGSTAIALYSQFGTVVDNYVKKETRQMVSQLANYYNERLIKTIYFTNSIFEDNEFKSSLAGLMNEPSYNYAIVDSVMQDLFSKALIKEMIIDSFFLYTPKGVFFKNSKQLQASYNDESLQEYKQIKTLPKMFWGQSKENDLFAGNDKIIPVVTNIPLDVFYNDVFFVLNLSENEFLAPLRDISRTNNASFYILDQYGSSVITRCEYKNYEKALLEQQMLLLDESGGYFKFRNDGENLYVNFARININDWIVVAVQPESKILKDLNVMKIFTIILGVALVLIAGLLSFILAATVTKPIYTLRNKMQMVSNGDLTVRFDIKYQDEIGELAGTFNKMLEDTEKLINELEEQKRQTKDEQSQKRAAEMRALQAQINPHFLYNTLDSIYWKAKNGRNELVGDMIISLSQMLRVGLSKGMDTIPVLLEAEHVKNYLYLQSNVYENKFDYEIKVNGELSGESTIKLIIQPLVENSILHGFENLEYKGQLIVDIKSVGDNIHFRVEDNGSGFDADYLEDEVKNGIFEKGGYALKNVYQRLLLSYGNKAQMHFKSEPYLKSIIEIIIPKEDKNKEDKNK